MNQQPMNERNKQKNSGKKKSGGAWALLGLALVWLFNSLDGGKLQHFFRRIRWMLQTGRLSVDEEIFAVIFSLFVLIVVIGVLVSVAKKMKAAREKTGSARRGGTAEHHSHDRIQGYAAGGESGYMHWKKQLDGFLAAGLIDRKEYNELLARRKDNYIG